MPSELQIQTRITDIEPKLDKNANFYYKLTLQGSSHYFYAFPSNLPATTQQTLQETPHKLVNQLALISYQELPNKNHGGTFFKIKAIELLT